MKNLNTPEDIGKIIDKVEKSELKAPTGTIIGISDFVQTTNKKLLTDRDGIGRLIVDNKRIHGSTTDIERKEISIIGPYRVEYRIKFDDIEQNLSDRAAIEWLSR